MNTLFIRYIKTIEESRNITEAAKKLYISQPALTKTLHTLEQSFGTPLFIREKRQLRLTEAGRIFLKYGETMLANEEKMTAEIKKLAERKQESIALGIPGSRGEIYLPLDLPRYKEVCPQVSVQVVEGYSQQLEDLLEAHIVDIAITTLPIREEQLSYKILSDDLVMLGASRHSSFAQRFDLSKNSLFTPYLITPDMLDGQSFMLVKSGYGTRRISDSILKKHGLQASVFQEFSRHDTAVRMSAVSNQLCITPCSTAVRLHLQDTMCFFTLDNPVVNRHVIAAWRKDYILTEYEQKLIDVVQGVSREINLHYVQLSQVKVLDGRTLLK